MSKELQGLPNIAKVVDENIVYSADDLTTHATFVRKFLADARKRGIALERDKFAFAKSKITFAGIVFSDRGYKIQDKVLSAIKDFSKPESFQGMAQSIDPL